MSAFSLSDRVVYIQNSQLHLAGKPLNLKTDLRPITFLNDVKFKNNRITHWELALQGYDYTVMDIPDKDNTGQQQNVMPKKHNYFPVFQVC